MFSPLSYMKIDSSNQFINIKIIYNNLGSEISDAFPNLPDITVCDATSYKLYVQKSTFSKKNLWRSLQSHYDYNIRIEGLLDWKTAQIAKIFVQTIMPDRKFKSGSHLPKKVVFSLLQGKSFKIIKNAFYFRWKALFDFDIITFLSWLFGYVKSRLISKFMTSQTEEQ